MPRKSPNYNVILPPGTLLEGPDLSDPVPLKPKKPRDDTHRLLKNRASKKGPGGCWAHDHYSCKCNPCQSRLRAEEALSVTAGIGRAHMAPKSEPTKALIDENGHVRAPRRALRQRVSQYLHYSISNPNASLKEISGMMGIAPGTLYKVIKEGQETGILTFEDPLARIEHQIIPKVVDNLNYFLDARDKTVTIEAAKGTIFRQFIDSKGISDGNQTVLALKIEPADGQEVKIMTGHIVGVPKGTPFIREVDET